MKMLAGIDRDTEILYLSSAYLTETQGHYKMVHYQSLQNTGRIERYTILHKIS